MDTEELRQLKKVLDALDDLVTSVQYYCIGIYGVSDSFVNESLTRAQNVSAQARKKFLEVKCDKN